MKSLLLLHLLRVKPPLLLLLLKALLQKKASKTS
jgi:hypothetical protein